MVLLVLVLAAVLMVVVVPLGKRVQWIDGRIRKEERQQQKSVSVGCLPCCRVIVDGASAGPGLVW